MHTSQHLALPIAVVLSLIGCGGGSAGNAQPAPSTLTVVDATPAAGAQTGADARPILNFSDALPAAGISPGAVVLSDAIGTVDTMLGVNASELTVTPTQPLVWGSHYRLEVTTALMSGNGTALAAPYSISFDTRMPSWGTAAAASAAVPGVFNNRLKVGSASSGNVVAIWTRDASIVASDFNAVSQTWSNPTPIQGNLLHFDSYDLAVNDQGDAVAVWGEVQVNGYAIIKAARYAASNARWGQPVQISRLNGPSSRYAQPRVAIDHAGNIVAAWWQNDDSLATPISVYAANFDAKSQVWLAPRSLQDSSNSDIPLALAIDATGNAIVAWAQASVRSGPHLTTVARYDAGAKAWGDAVTIQASARDTLGVTVASDPSGNAMVAWLEQSGTGTAAQMIASYYPAAGKRWGTPVPLAEGDISLPTMAFDRAGNAMLLSNQYGPGKPSIIQCRRYAHASGTWSEGPNLVNPNYADLNVVLAIDPAGNAVIASFGHVDVEHSVVRATRFSSTTNKWDEWTQVSSTAGAMGEPALAIDRTGQAMLMWPQYGTFRIDSDMNIAYARFTGH